MAQPVFSDKETEEQVRESLTSHADKAGLEGKQKATFIENGLMIASIFNLAIDILDEFGEQLANGKQRREAAESE